jgi:hypothetical protein
MNLRADDTGAGVTGDNVTGDELGTGVNSVAPFVGEAEGDAVVTPKLEFRFEQHT